MNEFAIHYHLQDGVHEMNAKTLNVCEAKVLMIIDRILSALELNFDTELIVRTEGGIRDILKLKPKTTFDRFVCNILLPILSTMVYDLLKEAIRNPSQLYISQEQIEQISEALNAKMQTVPTPETSVEISAAQERQKLAVSIVANLNKFNTDIELNNSLQRDKSLLYKQLKSDDSITALSIEQVSIAVDGTLNFEEDARVPKNDFDSFILENERLEPTEDREAVIEIISPVLDTTKRYKWRGIYNDEEIEFTMSDNEVKTNIARGLTRFGAGSLMSGVLKIQRKRNELGQIVPISYTLTEAFTIPTDNGGEVITNRGIRERQRLRETNLPEQPNLFTITEQPESNSEE